MIILIEVPVVDGKIVGHLFLEDSLSVAAAFEVIPAETPLA
jgi:hypothetical protein